MSRLIDADALTKRFVEFCNKNCPYTAKARNVMCGSCFMGLALEAVEDAPTIEERKTGKWIGYNTEQDGWKRTDGSPVFMSCSECNGLVLNNGSAHWNFCPNCGAKMEAET